MGLRTWSENKKSECARGANLATQVQFPPLAYRSEAATETVFEIICSFFPGAAFL